MRGLNIGVGTASVSGRSAVSTTIGSFPSASVVTTRRSLTASFCTGPGAGSRDINSQDWCGSDVHETATWYHAASCSTPYGGCTTWMAVSMSGELITSKAQVKVPPQQVVQTEEPSGQQQQACTTTEAAAERDTVSQDDSGSPLMEDR